MIKFAAGFAIGMMTLILIFMVFSIVSVLVVRAKARRMYRAQIKYTKDLISALTECKKIYPDNDSIDSILTKQKAFLTKLKFDFDNI